jgi:hypothetical protein
MYYSEDDYGLGFEAGDALNRLIRAGYRFNFSDVNSREIRHMYKDDINVYISFHTNKGKSYVDSMQCVKNEVGIATTYKKAYVNSLPIHYMFCEVDPITFMTIVCNKTNKLVQEFAEWNADKILSKLE